MDQTITITQGSLADFLQGILGKGIKLDYQKFLSHPQTKAAILSVAGALKESTTAPFDLDDTVIDFISSTLISMLDKAVVQAPPAHIVVGATKVYTKEMAEQWVYGKNLPADCVQKILANPKVLEGLNRLPHDKAMQVAGDSKLLDMLIKYGPIILNLLMTLLPFIL